MVDVPVAGSGTQAESAAFGELYQRYFDPVYWYCRRRLPDAESAEDAAAHVFANALAAGPRWSDPSLRSWLFSIAHKRPFTLWEALKESRLPNAMEAYNRLRAWRSRLDFERPYEFYASVLYAEGGLRRFHSRFGPEVDDLFAEFLDLALEHESAANPSLQGFLAEMRSRDVTITPNGHVVGSRRAPFSASRPAASSLGNRFCKCRSNFRLRNCALMAATACACCASRGRLAA